MTETTAKRDLARPPSHPGEVLREDVLPALEMSASAAAKALGVSRQTLHAVLSGATSVAPAMALRLGKFCGNGPLLWRNMQRAFDLWHAERALAAELQRTKTHRAA